MLRLKVPRSVNSMFPGFSGPMQWRHYIMLIREQYRPNCRSNWPELTCEGTRRGSFSFIWGTYCNCGYTDVVLGSRCQIFNDEGGFRGVVFYVHSFSSQADCVGGGVSLWFCPAQRQGRGHDIGDGQVPDHSRFCKRKGRHKGHDTTTEAHTGTCKLWKEAITCHRRQRVRLSCHVITNHGSDGDCVVGSGKQVRQHSGGDAGAHGNWVFTTVPLHPVLRHGARSCPVQGDGVDAGVHTVLRNLVRSWRKSQETTDKSNKTRISLLQQNPEISLVCSDTVCPSPSVQPSAATAETVTLYWTPGVRLWMVWDSAVVFSVRLLLPSVQWTLKDCPPTGLVQLRDADDVVKSVTWRSVTASGSV